MIFVSVLFGCVLARMGESGRLMREFVASGTKWVFGVINVLMWAAPLGVFGAMAFTVGRYGLASLGPLHTRRVSAISHHKLLQRLHIPQIVSRIVDRRLGNKRRLPQPAIVQ